MNNIIEQVKELKELASEFDLDDKEEISNMLNEAAETIELLYKKQSDSDWIPCSERLPDEKINHVTNDFYEYQVTFRSDEVTDVRHYKFGRGHWWNGPGIMDKYVTAWREPLEAYHE